MIISQLALCEECRDGSCKACKAFKRRQRRRTMKHATSTRLHNNAGMQFPVCGITDGPLDLDRTAWPQGEVVNGKQVVTCKKCLAKLQKNRFA